MHRPQWAFWNSAIHPSVCPSICLSHGAAAWATGTLAACSLATASGGHAEYASRLRRVFMHRRQGALWNSVICLSVPWHSCMGYRHTGCLQLNHCRAEAYCLATLGQYRVKITLNVVEQMCLITALFDSGMRCASRLAMHASNTRLMIKLS